MEIGFIISLYTLTILGFIGLAVYIFVKSPMNRRKVSDGLVLDLDKEIERLKVREKLARSKWQLLQAAKEEKK